MMITIVPNSSKGWLINQPLAIVSLLGWNSKVSINYVIDDIKTTVSEWLSTWGVSASYRNHFIWGCTKHLCHTYSYFQGNINKQQPFLSIHRLLSRPCDGPWRSTVRRHALPWPVTSPPKSSSPSSHLDPFWDWFGTEKICRTLHFFGGKIMGNLSEMSRKMWEMEVNNWEFDGPRKSWKHLWKPWIGAPFLKKTIWNTWKHLRDKNDKSKW
jgi:hypothetical protein